MRNSSTVPCCGAVTAAQSLASTGLHSRILHRHLQMAATSALLRLPTTRAAVARSSARCTTIRFPRSHAHHSSYARSISSAAPRSAASNRAAAAPSGGLRHRRRFAASAAAGSHPYVSAPPTPNRQRPTDHCRAAIVIRTMC